MLTRRKPQPTTEALNALRAAEAGKRKEEARGPEVTRVATSLRHVQVRNHFSEVMEHLSVKGDP